MIYKLYNFTKCSSDKNSQNIMCIHLNNSLLTILNNYLHKCLHCICCLLNKLVVECWILIPVLDMHYFYQYSILYFNNIFILKAILGHDIQ